MKVLIKKQRELIAAGRCDIDFHLPPEHLQSFPENIIVKIDTVASIVKAKRNPTLSPDELFQYVDISSVDVSVGRIVSPQELLGEEAPSRARKAIQEGDIIISTCRPTRGAIAIIPAELDGQVCSTGFSVVRANTKKVIPQFLHWALRLESTLEQFRKWSTGSSYPAILDEDVAKTRIPVPDLSVQKKIIESVGSALRERDRVIEAADRAWDSAKHAAQKELQVSVSR